MNLKNETGAAMAASRSAYEAKVGVEAVLRSGGKNPQLKGVVHEILYRDALTMKPGNLANGVRGTLSKSVTAVRDDVLLKQGGAVDWLRQEERLRRVRQLPLRPQYSPEPQLLCGFPVP